MGFLELANDRISVRAYDDRKVEIDKIEKLIQAANLAPTACNLQPFHLIVVQSEEGLKKIGKTANLFGAPLAIIFAADDRVAWKRKFDDKNFADIDTTIVTDHVMLEATELGLGSVWIGYFDPEEVAKDFQIPPDLRPLNILAIGYEAEEHEKKEKSRKKISDIFSFEKYAEN